ncbi:MAG TPA: hypothetical protein VEX18_16070 [Polyangiaceae bacterium]|nr:hypothetical protein [Polyangiaceae bacterium]
MKASKAWYVAGLVAVAGLSSASCGKDEASGNPGSGGDLIEGGSGGSGGTRNLGGSSGSGGSGAPVGATKLGRGCIDDADCDDTNAPGLTCITASETLLGDGAPPGGLCTAECASDDECTALGAGSVCFPFEDGAATGYCVEGCSFGEPGIGEIKCHNRDEFACNPALLGPTTQACAETEDCPAGDLCIDGTCAVVFPACLPACRGDIDCEDGMYCDQSFLSGVCVTEKPTGKALGEPCTVPGENEDSEPDECLGFCQADTADSTTGRCSATCGIGLPCAYNSESGNFDGACFYASVLTAEIGRARDFGFCTPSCDCSDECNSDELACSLLDDQPLGEGFKGQGLCFGVDPAVEEYNQCEGMGGSGAGGSSGSAGEGGSPPAAVGGDGAGGAGG